MPLARFHSMSFPSEWGLASEVPDIPTTSPFPFNEFPQRVGTRNVSVILAERNACFHSMSFPSEWGRFWIRDFNGEISGFHSMSFPSEWGRFWIRDFNGEISGFHSMSFPSEWGR